MATAFEVLNGINVNDHTEKKKTGGTELTYLSWAWAWAEAKKRFPDISYEIEKFDGLPYVYDPKTGYMVYTRVTLGDTTHEMWLPVMDGAFQAMKSEPYTYQVKEYKYGKWTGGYVDKRVEAATMFDINTTIMRCLVKNLAMFGLGLYIYAGEDIPEDSMSEEEIQDVARREEVRKEKIGVDRAITLLHQMEANGISPSVISDRYRVANLEDLTYEMESDIIKNRDILKIETICRDNDIDLNLDKLTPKQIKSILEDPQKNLIEKAKARTA